jgi:serine/threonine protein kinase
MNEEELFEQALETPEADRAALLDRLCADNPALRERIEKLLAAHMSSAFNFDPTLQGPSDGTAAEDVRTFAMPTNSTDPNLNAVLGEKYKLLQSIGEGGMGNVYLASQTQPVKRMVAVKVVKAGMDSKAILARFEAERQALAMMEHPNIAKVLDAGTTEQGRPYFVMELVKGTPITQFCDEHKLTPKERLELFLPVCEAIQHSHQKGIIHRDIKPSNVLVAMYDDHAVPKVIDFGVAKATGQSLTDMSVVTGFGALVGTPEYMSPEQASLNNMDIDTRSDVYSLGVLLYELLSGHTPVDRKSLEKAAIYEILRIVRDVDAPRLSAKLSSIDTLPNVAANRKTEPRKLTNIFRGELDWVLQKALEKDRSRRYATANGLARDIQRYLADEIVEARPPSTAYRLTKFVRHHKGQVLAASLVFLALMAGMAGTTWGLFRAEERRVEAERARANEATQRVIAEANEAKAIEAKEEEARQRTLADAAKMRAIEFKNKALQALRATTSEDVEKLIGEKKELTANERAYLEAIAKRWQAFAAQEGTDLEARSLSGEGHFRVADLWDILGKQEESVDELEKAETVYSKLMEEFPASVESSMSLASTYNNLGMWLKNLGRNEESLDKYLKGLAIQKKLTAEYPDDPDHREGLANTYSNLAVYYEALGKSLEASESFRESLLLEEKLVADFPGRTIYRKNLATTFSNLGSTLMKNGKLDEAREQCRKGLAIREKLLSEFPKQLEFQKDLAASLNNYSNLLSLMGNTTESVEQVRKSVAISKKLSMDYPSIPSYSESLARSYSNMGIELVKLRKSNEAESAYRNALEIKENLARDFPKVPEYQQELAVTHRKLGELLARRDKDREALEQYRKGLTVIEKLALEHTNVPDYQRDLAATCYVLGNFVNDFKDGPKRSEPYYRLALSTYEKLTAEFPEQRLYRDDIAKVHYELGNALFSMQKRAEAEEQYLKGIAVREKLVLDFPDYPDYRVDLTKRYVSFAEMKLETKDASASLLWFEKAFESLKKVPEFESQLASYQRYLVRSFQGRGKAYDQLRMETKADADWQKARELSSEEDQCRVRTRRAIHLVFDGQVPKAIAMVEELAKLPIKEAKRWYEMGSVYSLASKLNSDQDQKYSDRAMELLKKAAKLDYGDVESMTKDTNLDPVRERDDFKQLVEELKEKKKMSSKRKGSEEASATTESKD